MNNYCNEETNKLHGTRTKVSSLCSQQPATSPYPEPTESTPHLPQSVSLRSILIPSYLCLGLPNCLFPSGFPTNLIHFSLLSHACHMPCSPHLPLLDLPNDIWGWVQIIKLLTVQLPHSPLTSSLLHPISSNTFSLCSSLSVRDQVSHPYKKNDRIMVLYTLTFTFLDSRREKERA
jgi:hypothetical protein